MIIPAELYKDLLDKLKMGSAIWLPDDSLGNIHIGDIGFIAGGKFKRFFYAPSPDPDVIPNIPAGWERLPFDPEKDIFVDPHFLPAFRALYSGAKLLSADPPSKTKPFTYTFEVGEEAAVVIPLADVEMRHLQPSCIEKWQDYVARQHHIWQKISRSAGLVIRPNTIMLLNGVMVTKRWANALMVGKGIFKMTIDLNGGVAVLFESPPGGEVWGDAAPSRDPPSKESLIADGIVSDLWPLGDEPDHFLFIKGNFWQPPTLDFMKFFGANPVKGSSVPKNTSRRVQERKNSGKRDAGDDGDH